MISVPALRERDGDDCWLCATVVPMEDENPPGPLQSTRDHVIPKRLGGRDWAENIRLAHRLCNNRRPDTVNDPGTMIPPMEWLNMARGPSTSPRRRMRSETIFKIGFGRYMLMIIRQPGA
jgi:HNH endonuclease